VHDASWWAKFPAVSKRFDAALLVDGLGELLQPKVTSPLLRREVEIATEWEVRRLNRPQSKELAESADSAVQRLALTLRRIEERSEGAIATAEPAALLLALQGKYAEAGAAAEPIVGTAPLQRLFVTALRMEYFDIPLATRLLEGGQSPQQAITAAALIGHYSWWPSWLLRVVTDRAFAGTLDTETIRALDRCAYAELTPLQARLARRLLEGDQDMVVAAASRLEALGEVRAAEQLREGDLNAVALAARLVPL
jgi:hypothetical protein